MLLSLLGPSLEETRAASQLLGHPRNDTLSEWFTGSPAHSGVLVSQHSAMTVMAVYRAIALISGCVSRLPLHVYRDKGNDHHEREAGHDYEHLLNVQINDDMDAQSGREVLQSWTLASGTAPAEVVWGRSRVEALWPIKPSRVSPKRINNQLIYEVTDEDGGRVQTVPKEKLFTMIGPSPDGIVGYSPIRVAREAIGLALAAERYGAGFFGNGAVPKGILYYEGQKSEQAERHFREMWNETHQSPQNANKTAILRAGWKYEAISLPPDDAQFLETQKWSIHQVARLFGVPPHLLGDLDRATFNNIEHMSLEFLLYCLDYWLNKWENRLRLWLFTKSEIKAGFYFKHQRRAITAMDAEARAKSNREAISAGYRSVNEAKVLEGENPIGAEGDLYRFPLNERTAKVAMAEESKAIREAEMVKPEEQGKPEPAAVESLEQAAQQGKTSQTALAGQQITALQGILAGVGSGQLAKPAAKRLIKVSFPMFEDGDISAMVDAIEVKKPEPAPATPPSAAIPATNAEPPKNVEPAKPPISPKLKAAAHRTLADAVGRMRRIERAEAVRAAKKLSEWPKWFDAFWPEHEQRMRQAIEPAAEVFAALLEQDGMIVTASFVTHEIVSQHCTRTKEEILTATTGDPETFAERIESLCATWETRSFELPKELTNAV